MVVIFPRTHVKLGRENRENGRVQDTLPPILKGRDREGDLGWSLIHESAGGTLSSERGVRGKEGDSKRRGGEC